MATKIIAIMLLCFSCASLQSGEWVEVTLSQKEQVWRWCTLELDGPKYAGLGRCWIGKECKSRFLKKDICRPKPYFCTHADVECQIKHGLDKKVLVSQ